MEQIINQLYSVIKTLETSNISTNRWLNAKETTPSSDQEKVVVRTKDGQMFFLSTINGKFPASVTEWLPLPKE